MQRKIKAAYDTVLYTSINSFNQRNPHCELTGCFFYLSQWMWSKIQEKCLSILYVNDHLFRKNIKCFCLTHFVLLKVYYIALSHSKIT
ncbi:hypothetical protein HZS_6233 [Henneguya salminicola]|nr:hypothetical protein HZS_6233 [Henneguya salminicola]